MLTSEMASKDNVAKYVAGCRQMEIPVLPPDINESNWTFTVVRDTIRFGLGAVKGIGSSAVEEIVGTRRRVGRFSDLTHFACEVDLKAVNHKAFECLIKSGSFDSLGAHRAALFESLDGILDFAQRQRRSAEQGQESLFSEEALPRPMPDDTVPEWPERQRLIFEKEALGLYLTGNPLQEHADALACHVTHSTGALGEETNGSITLGGVVTRYRQMKIKSGRKRRADDGPVRVAGYGRYDTGGGFLRPTAAFRLVARRRGDRTRQRDDSRTGDRTASWRRRRSPASTKRSRSSRAPSSFGSCSRCRTVRCSPCATR